MHFILAVLLLFFVIATTGDVINSEATTTLYSTSKCIPLDPNEAHCTSADPAAPAEGRLQPGDRIIAVNGRPASTYNDVRAQISASPGRPITLRVVRHKAVMDITLTPVAVRQNGKTVGRIGVSPTVRQHPVSVLGAIPRTFTTLGDVTVSTGHALADLPHQVSQILEGKPRSPTGAASVVDIARVSGQIGQAKVSFGERLASLVAIVASLNFFVGLFNLLPLLPLDGGHVAILLFEEARSRLYRKFGRRDPGRVDLMKVMPFTYAVVAVFVGLSLLLLYAGIANPIRIQ